MLLQRITKLIALYASVIALMTWIGLPETLSAQNMPGDNGANARSGPATGGVVGTIESVSQSSFMVTTSTGQKVLVNESPSTEYLNGTTSTTANALTKDAGVLILGIVNGRSITARKVILQSDKGTANASVSATIPFQRGAPSAARKVGQIPDNYTEGSGTIVNGIAANKATQAALTSYSGGVVDRVVELSDGEYEVHNIGVNWPHHIFVSSDFKVVAAF